MFVPGHSNECMAEVPIHFHLFVNTMAGAEIWQ